MALSQAKANYAWMNQIKPIKGEFRAFMVGVAAGAIFHEGKFGQEWERSRIMVPLQKALSGPNAKAVMKGLGMFADELIVPYFAILYWTLDKYKCVYGIWLVPISECVNGMLKYYFKVPRPAWVDSRVAMASWSHEYSFPSSHAQIIWALASFFAGTSANPVFFESLGGSTTSYWYFLALPYLFASSVSVSRVYEGMHYPRDIAVGAGVGVGLASVYMRILPGLKEFLKRQPALLRMGYLSSISVALAVATKSFAEYARRGTAQSDLALWAESAVASNPAKHAPKKATGRTPSMASLAVKPTTGSSGHGELPNLDPINVPLNGYNGMIGVVAGLAVGETLIGSLPSLRMPLPRSRLVAIVRVLLGLTGLMGGFLGIRHVEKKHCKSGSSDEGLLRFLRHAYVPVWILNLAPLLFAVLEGRSSPEWQRALSGSK